MPQIKMTVTEEEKHLMEQQAAEEHLTMSGYIHARIFGYRKVGEPKLPSYIDRSSSRKISLVLPEELLNSLDEAAAAEHLNRSAYITNLLVQKGKPVNITYSEEPAIRISDTLSSLMNSIEQLTDMAARSNGPLYDSEIAAIAADLKKVDEELHRQLELSCRRSRKSIRTIRNELLRNKDQMSR